MCMSKGVADGIQCRKMQSYAYWRHEQELSVPLEVVEEEKGASHKRLKSFTTVQLVTKRTESWIWWTEQLFMSLKRSCWTCTNHWYAHMLKTVHQCGHLVIRKTKHWLRECSIVSQGWFRDSPSCHTVRLKRLWLWSLEERRNTANLIEVFKMVKGFSGISMESVFELSTTKHLRGHE